MSDVRAAIFGSAVAATFLAACSGSVDLGKTQPKRNEYPDAGVDAAGYSDSTTSMDKSCGASGRNLADAGAACMDPPTVHGNYHVTWASGVSSLRGDVSADGVVRARFDH